MFQGLRNSAHGVAEEFKKFVMRGNVVDLAVGIIIGTAFKGITTSLVKDVITPPHRSAHGRPRFFQLGQLRKHLLNFGREVETAAATINIGNFVNLVIDFAQEAGAATINARQGHSSSSMMRSMISAI